MDLRLKATCEKFIASATSALVGPLQTFLLQVTSHFALYFILAETSGSMLSGSATVRGAQLRKVKKSKVTSSHCTRQAGVEAPSPLVQQVTTGFFPLSVRVGSVVPKNEI